MPCARQIVNRPEAADTERAFAAAKPVTARRIAKKQSVASELLRDAPVRRLQPAPVRGLVADARHQQQTRIHRATVELARIARDVLIIAALLDQIGNRFALPSE